MMSDSCRIRRSFSSRVFEACAQEISDAEHPLWHRVEGGDMRNTVRLRSRALGMLGVPAALQDPAPESAAPESALMRIFCGSVPLQANAVSGLRRWARRWAEDYQVEHLLASVLALLRRGDVPEAVRYSPLRTMCNVWVTSRRLSQEMHPCRMGCGVADADCLEQHIYKPKNTTAPPSWRWLACTSGWI